MKFLKYLLSIRWLALIIALVGYISVQWSLSKTDCSFGDFALNAGTELLGIAITIGFVQYLFDMMQQRIDLESLAWDVLFDTDYAIWVWQGGERVFNMEELLYLIDKISPTDPFPATTQNVILALGNKASNLLKTKKNIISKNDKLAEVMEELTQLARLRDKGVVKPLPEIAKIFQNSVLMFAEILDIKYDKNSDEIFDRDCSGSMQIWRHTGETIAPIAVDPLDLEKNIKTGVGVN